MSNKTTKSAPKKKVSTKRAEPTFSINRLRRDCLELFGVTVSTFDGATRDLEGFFTVAQMKDKINLWQNQSVLPGTKKEVQ